MKCKMMLWYVKSEYTVLVYETPHKEIMLYVIF